MRTYTLVFSIAAHVAVACVVLFSTVLATDQLPEPRRASVFVEVFPAPAPTPPPPARPQPVRVTRPDLAPIEAPAGVRPEPEPLVTDFDRPDASAGGVLFGNDSDRALMLRDEPPPPPPVRPLPPSRVGGDVRAPQRITHVPPIYPAVARAARISGVVILDATIDADGSVRDARVIRSIPLLDQAAVDAVRQWKFTPTLLNGQPVAVLMTVTVAFTLD